MRGDNPLADRVYKELLQRDEEFKRTVEALKKYLRKYLGVQAHAIQP